jgi:uncharacterized membrane protein YhaH (DUF805 family)
LSATRVTIRKPLDWALLPLKKYADFSGRASRPEYWWFLLLTAVASLIGGVLLLVLILPSFAVTVRRLHDLDRSGWWALVPAAGLTVPFALFMSVMRDSAAYQSGDTDLNPLTLILYGGAFVVVGLQLLLLYWFTQPGTPGPNRFGPDPAEDNRPIYYS